MVSPYEILGVDPDADEEAVVDAYRQKVKEVHPDHGGSMEAFQAVKRAKERIEDGYDPEEDGETWAQPEDDQPTVKREGSRVEYLNYEVLDDYGWAMDDDDLFEKAAAANLDSVDHGSFHVEPNETLLEAAESNGYAWPFACRGGACTNCAVAIVEGEIPPPTGHILPQDLLDRGFRLSCLAAPTTDEAKVLFNVKHVPEVSEFLLSASRFEQAHSDD